MTDTDKPDLAERYTSAVGTSNLRVQAERGSPADMVIAAGMNPHRLGMALRRLVTEWDAQPKPRKISREVLEALAAAYPRLETGMVDWKGQLITPAQAAHREVQEWHAHELGLLFQRLKTLPEVRAVLTQWATEKGIEGPEHLVAAVLQWWLNPICPVCHGVKKKVIHGTGHTSGKDCWKCKGSGESDVPHGSRGRMVKDHINRCLTSSVVGLRNKFKR